MTNQNIPAGITPEEAKKAREWALHALNKPGASTTAEKAVARVVIGTVPEPRPTLADMTLEERAACLRMQCDVAGVSGQWVLITPYDDDADAVLIDDDGGIEWADPERVTPRPDLPRMEWPAGAPVQESTLAVGSVWDDADALAQACEESGRDQIIALDRAGGAYVWDEMAEWWEGSAPPRFAPYTILHIGRKADQ